MFLPCLSNSNIKLNSPFFLYKVACHAVVKQVSHLQGQMGKRSTEKETRQYQKKEVPVENTITEMKIALDSSSEE